MPVLPSPRARARDPLAAPSSTAQVVVLGMHRSGTSVLAGLLRLLGLWVGEEGDFPPADEHNQAGYWEHRGVWAADEAVLETLGASWCETAGLDLSRLDEGARARFREQAGKIVQELGRQGPWVIKDPRLCLLFPLWREILAHPFCVLIYREPLPVARSLAARDGLSIPYGIALWEQHNREALASTRGLPRVLVSHQELMADPVATLRRLHHHLTRLADLEPASLRVPAPEEIHGVVKPSLVHHPEEPEAERRYLTPPQRDLLEALVNGTALELDPVPPLSAGARDLLLDYQRLSALARQLTAQAHARAASLHRAVTWIDELDAIVSALLDSRSWKIGRALTSVVGCLRGRSRISAAERRDRLMAEVRRWREPKGR
jgi:hypothetical protein